MMSATELRREVLKRGYKCSYNKVKYHYRQILRLDDFVRQEKEKSQHKIECQNTSQILPKV